MEKECMVELKISDRKRRGRILKRNRKIWKRGACVSSQSFKCGDPRRELIPILNHVFMGLRFWGVLLRLHVQNMTEDGTGPLQGPRVSPLNGLLYKK